MKNTFIIVFLKSKRWKQTPARPVASFFGVRLYNYFQFLLSSILWITDSSGGMRIRIG